MRSRAGFSIMEVMVAMVMITVALLATITAMGNSYQNNRVTAERDQAMAEIVRQIEILQQMRSTDLYDRVSGTTGYDFAAFGLPAAEGRALPGQVTLASGTTRNDPAMRLTISVTWTGPLGISSISLPYTHVDR